jgi:mannose-6-phosphate isomerase-like protein (cupin superfamily)
MEIGNRPWGKYEVLYDGDDCKVKRITVNPGGQLSLQYHKHRMEDWIIVSGKGDVTINGTTRTVSSPDTVHILQGDIHRVTNTSDEPFVFIEVQRGTYFGEDDIVRLEDKYGRTDEN